jgi:phospholipid/cholesterol/gamma-HCH transport system substrate-binding protein
MSRLRSVMSYERIGVVTVAAVVAITVVVFAGGVQRIRERKGEPVEAVFGNPSRLAVGNPVRVNGAVQGRVKKITLDPGGRTSTVRMEVFEDSLPLYRNATATINMRIALGGNFVVNLDPGTPGAGELRAQRIPLSQTGGQTEVDEILSNLRDTERRGMRTMLAELPKALRDDHALERALASVADVSPSLRTGVRALRGERDGDLRRLVQSTARAVGALAEETEPLRSVVEGGAVTLETTARRAADIQATIERADQILPRVITTLRLLDSTLATADPVVSLLRRPAPAIAPTVARLRPTVVDADRLLRLARPLLASLRPASAALARAARAGHPLLDELTPSLQRLDDNILPDLAKPDPVTGRGTHQMIGPTLSGLGAAAAGVDNISHMVALAAGGGERAIDTSPCRTYFTDPTAQQIAACRSIAETLNRLLHYNPLPGRRSP